MVLSSSSFSPPLCSSFYFSSLLFCSRNHLPVVVCCCNHPQYRCFGDRIMISGDCLFVEHHLKQNKRNRDRGEHLSVVRGLVEQKSEVS